MKRINMSFPKALFYILLFILYSCNSSTETTEENKTHLEVYDVSCTEVWLHLKVERISLPAGGVVRIEGIKEMPVTITTNDTLLFFDSLEVNREYKFKVILQNPGQTLTTNEATARTLNTTSHIFKWETFEIGSGQSCWIDDVAMIDENDIWAVGSITLKDSLEGGTMIRFNAIHWDGSKWELKRIYYPTVCSNSSSKTSYPTKSIFLFDNKEIWTSTAGDKIAIINNGLQSKSFCIPANESDGGINKIAGYSNKDLYYAGSRGNLGYYNGSKWKNIETGTTKSINDIYGVKSREGKRTVFCAVSYVFQPGDYKVLKINGENQKVDSISLEKERRVHTVWAANERIIYTGGGGIYDNKRGYWQQSYDPIYYVRNIRGTGHNDIYACGDYCMFAHFNGLTWKRYYELYGYGAFNAIAIKGKTIILVGYKGERALIVRGVRD